MDASHVLLSQLDRLHTTARGAERIRTNLSLTMHDITGWCKDQIRLPDCRITQEGKNFYAHTGRCVITINAKSFTIITAHANKRKPAPSGKAILLQFMDALNGRDCDTLMRLLSEDFSYADSLGQCADKKAMHTLFPAWFEKFPDLEISTHDILSRGTCLALFGEVHIYLKDSARQSPPLPIACKAAVKGWQIILWQVVCGDASLFSICETP